VDRISVIASTYYSEKKAIFHKRPETGFGWRVVYSSERRSEGGGVQHSGFENKMFWMGIFAIAGVLPVKTMLEDCLLERIRLAKFRSKTRLDCSVKLRLGTKLDQESPRRGVFTALSLRARAFAKRMKLVFLYSYRIPPDALFLMTGPRGLHDGYYFY
jgi:hypothetical protein